jgi:hypothetical protein
MPASERPAPRARPVCFGVHVRRRWNATATVVRWSMSKSTFSQAVWCSTRAATQLASRGLTLIRPARLSTIDPAAALPGLRAPWSSKHAKNSLPNPSRG